MEVGAFRISSINYVQNPYLWQLHAAHESMIEHAGEVRVEWGFHGTDSNVINPNIILNGLDVRYVGKNGHKFGKGCYISKKARYSHGFCTRDADHHFHMLYVRMVCPSQLVCGQPDMAQAICGPALLDHVATDPGNSMFVSFAGWAQMYPAFIIKYAAGSACT